MKRDPQLDFSAALQLSPIKTEVVSGWDLIRRLKELRVAGTPVHTLSTVSGYNAMWQIQWYAHSGRVQVKT